jgi:hypothetical protein
VSTRQLTAISPAINRVSKTLYVRRKTAHPQGVTRRATMANQQNRTPGKMPQEQQGQQNQKPGQQDQQQWDQQNQKGGKQQDQRHQDQKQQR